MDITKSLKISGACQQTLFALDNNDINGAIEGCLYINKLLEERARLDVFYGAGSYTQNNCGLFLQVNQGPIPNGLSYVAHEVAEFRTFQVEGVRGGTWVSTKSRSGLSILPDTKGLQILSHFDPLPSFIYAPYIPLQMATIPRKKAILVNTSESPTTDQYPHKCPKCGNAAYVGFSSVECSKGC